MAMNKVIFFIISAFTTGMLLVCFIVCVLMM